MTLVELIQRLIAGIGGEHHVPNLELKSSWKPDYGKKISSLGNRTRPEPSWLVVGIDDNGRILGNTETWAKTLEEQISQHVNRFLEATQTCAIRPADLSGAGWVVVIEITNPGTVVRWDGEAFKSPGTAKERMTPAEVMALQVSLPGLTDATAQRADEFEAHEDLIRHFATRLSARSDEPGFGNLALASASEVLAAARLTGRRAAKLLFGDTPWRVVTFDEAGSPTSNRVFSGLYRLLLPSMNEAFRKAPGIASSAYPENALREALANAVAHAAYFERSCDLIIELHPDHITISNLCLPASIHFANKWFSRSHNTVNPLLMETLRLAGNVDEVGRGKSVIMRECLLGGHPPPKVVSERAGQYARWRLMLFKRDATDLHAKIYARMSDCYHDDAKKALLATALVQWHEEPLSTIKTYVDGESLELFMDVLGDPVGPVIADPASNSLRLRRWAQVLAGEGQQSKALDANEEQAVKVQLSRHAKRNAGIFSPQDCRRFAGMGNTNSEHVLSSNLLKKWLAAKEVVRKSTGRYAFVVQPEVLDQQQHMAELLRLLFDPGNAGEASSIATTAKSSS